MRGSEAKRSRFSEFIEDGHPQRSAFFGVCGSPEFVQEDKAFGSDKLKHMLHMDLT